MIPSERLKGNACRYSRVEDQQWSQVEMQTMHQAMGTDDWGGGLGIDTPFTWSIGTIPLQTLRYSQSKVEFGDEKGGRLRCC